MIAAPILPYVLLAAVAGTSIAGVGGYVMGRSDGRALEAAQQTADEALIAKVADASQTAAAQAISAIQIKHTTIRQTVESQTRESPAYRDCVHAASVLDNINAALTGADAASGGQLPAADPAARPELRRDDAKADRRSGAVSAVQGGGGGG